MTRHSLSDTHRAHLVAIGIENPPAHLDVDDAEFRRHAAEWRRSLPQAGPEVWRLKALATIAWRQQQTAPPDADPKPDPKPEPIRIAPPAPKPIEIPQPVSHRLELRIIIVLLVLSFCARLAHCQFSRISSINVQDNTGTSVGFMTSPFVLKAGANCTPTRSGIVVTFNCAGGAATPGGSNGQGQYNANGALGGISSMTSDGTVVTQKVGTNFNLVDPADVTKITQFDLSAITTGTTRTVKIPDAASATARALAAVSHFFVTAFSQTTGSFTTAQPACGDLSDSGTLCLSSAALPANTTATAHNFFTAYNSTTGAFTKAQPACADVSDASTFCNGTDAAGLSGTLADARIPAKYRTGICQGQVGDGLNTLAAGTYVVIDCYNDFGATYTITAIRAYSDNNGTSTLNAANDAGTGLLTGAVTATNSWASGTQSGTTTIATSHWIKFSLVADGTSKQINYQVTATR
jgi:hypothetical protein